jgi:hypothetical protein
LLIFVIILVGVLGYLVWDSQNTPVANDDKGVNESNNSSDDSLVSGWLKYTDTESGYSFQYPTTYTYKKQLIGDVSYYIQAHKAGGVDTVGPLFRYTKYGETLAVDENDPPQQTIKVTNFAKLKEYMAAVGYKKIIDTSIDGNEAIFIDEESPQGKGKYYGYLVDGGEGYYSLDDHQDSVPSIERIILLTFQVDK